MRAPSLPPLRRAAERLRIFVESEWAPWLFFLWCGVVQMLYFIVTPYLVRAYDAKEHLDYVLYVQRHFSIPPSALGWEMHQPPLYYFLAWGWARLWSLAGATPQMLPVVLQVMAMLLSFVTLAAIFWIGTILFPKKEDRSSALLFSLILGTLPGIAMVVARVNNDTLAFPLSFLWCGWMLLWWRDGHDRHLWLATIAMALCLLTKVTAGALAIPMLLIVTLKNGIPMRKKSVLIAAILCAFAVLAGWYFAFRSLSHVEALLSSGTGDTNKFLLIENRGMDFVLFNPASILLAPFANPWDALSGRQYFLEFLFRSVFFGEWQFPHVLWMARMILGLGLFGLLMGAIGLIRSWRTERFALPMILLMGFLPVALAVHRALRTCACDQDFRFIPLISVPVTFWILIGFRSAWPHAPGRMWAWGCALVVLQSAFLLSFLVAG